RRRHTRFSRDWSSDVCSSDLFFVPNSRGRIGQMDVFFLGESLQDGFCNRMVDHSPLSGIAEIAHGDLHPSFGNVYKNRRGELVEIGRASWRERVEIVEGGGAS